jgi:hypothetical protein
MKIQRIRMNRRMNRRMNGSNEHKDRNSALCLVELQAIAHVQPLVTSASEDTREIMTRRNLVAIDFPGVFGDTHQASKGSIPLCISRYGGL